ncbi:MAG: DUF4255 domain-containing protein [Caldilineaceae bacterium]
MSSSAAIGKVSEALQQMLTEEMKDPKVSVTLLAPDESASGDRRVNLFLYKVQETPLLRGMDWQVKRSEPTKLAPPPLSLNLFYLLTAYAKAEQVITGNSTAHAILGEAMRILYENPTIPATYLGADLQQSREVIKIIQAPIDMEEMSRVWSTFGKPFRPSVMYEVSTVQIDTIDHEQPLAKRVEEVRIADVAAPFIPPTVERIAPIRGLPGTQITVYGAHLAGWKAVVRLTEEPIGQTDQLDADTFTVALPTDLKPGLYALRVDIEQLCRRTFFFEVQPS